MQDSKIGFMIKAAAAAAIVAVFVFFGAAASYAEVGKPSLVAHGGGFINGYETTNSVEAVMQSIADGYKLIELDIDLSSDGKPIMIHDWSRTARYYFGAAFNEKLSEKEFGEILVNGKFHTLTFEKLTAILDEAEDVRVITDVKDDNIGVLSAIAEMFPSYIERIIPQIYSYGQYSIVKRLGYRDVILTLYAMPTIDYDELLSFVRYHALYAVTVGDAHDYLIKDLKYRLANDGVLVYYHPVIDFEAAEEAMANGVYGVYANRLIPADFAEPARSYYLLDGGAKLCDLSLPEKSFKSLKDVKIKNGAGKTRVYLIDGQVATDELVSDLQEGRHDLRLVLTSNGKTVASLNYLLWSFESKLWILDKRYGYRLEEFEDPADMIAFLAAHQDVSQEVGEVLQNSLIVKAGEHYGYCNGIPLTFTVNEEFLFAQKYKNGSVLSPLSECMKAVGAESVTMDSGRYVYVYYGGSRTMMQAGTTYISRGIGSSRLATPLVLYRNKTMAPGEAYKVITGREYLDNQELMVLLPDNVKASEVCAEEILEAAKWLFDKEAELPEPQGQ
ncbi:MAG: hypothetical protein FWG42_03225 [Clostridiales bacterium]|nr:hypothetical protein [Clostridiales bacterium]